MHSQFRKTAFATSLALALGGLAAGSAYAAPRDGDTATQDVTEARQETQIWTTYALSPHLRASDLKVSVDNGKATLTGTVEEQTNKDLAKQIALGVSGIADVDNQIVVKADYVAPPAGTDRAYGEVVDDAFITATVKSKLAWSRNADAMTTDVDTQRGKVTLTGAADTDEEKERAGRLAADTRGVVSVDNRLVVEAAKKGSDAAKNGKGKAAAQEGRRDVADGWITTKVKSTFMYSSNVDGSDISVSTRKGIVTLSGKVDSGAERALAIELAENVRGVKSVQSKGLTVSDVVANR